MDPNAILCAATDVLGAPDIVRKDGYGWDRDDYGWNLAADFAVWISDGTIRFPIIGSTEPWRQLWFAHVHRETRPPYVVASIRTETDLKTTLAILTAYKSEIDRLVASHARLTDRRGEVIASLIQQVSKLGNDLKKLVPALLEQGPDRMTDEQRTQLSQSYKLVEKYANLLLTGREPISAAVKQIVWQRDAGRCRLCGSGYKLHFDHDIPVSKGGGNGVENIRLLCEACNLKKGSKIE